MGQVQFFILDTESIIQSASSAPNVYGPQYIWLHDQLLASTAKYKLVVVGQTPYSSSNLHQGGPDGGSSLEYLQWPYEAWGATAVFSGDEHVYERVMRDDNSDGKQFPYFVTGNGGRVLAGFDSPAVTGSAVRLAQFGAIIVTANDTSITFDERTVGGGAGGTISDTLTINAPVDNWTSYIDTYSNGDTTIANALKMNPPTTSGTGFNPFGASNTFTLKNAADGTICRARAPVQVLVDASVDQTNNDIPTASPTPGGSTPAAGDANTAFTGFVSGQGVYSFTSTAGTSGT